MRTVDPDHHGHDLLAPEFLAAAEHLPAGGIDAGSLAEVRRLFGTTDTTTFGGGDPGATEITEHAVPGSSVTLRIHHPAAGDTTTARPAVYAIHGGGYVLGTAAMLDPQLTRWGARLGCVGISVEYRLAPEHPFPEPLLDCHAGLAYVHEHAAELGIDPARIGLQGTSAGGGLAAALALFERDEGGLPIAFQLLECPMLDDRQQTASSRLDRLLVWSRESNEFGWRSYLGARWGTDDVPAHAAPSRATDLSGLPPAFVAAGGADGFRDEDVDYANRLMQAGVPTELHVYPGVPHGHMLVPDSPGVIQWDRDVEDWLRRRFAV